MTTSELAAESVVIPQMEMTRVAKACRQMADEILSHAPAESMYLCSIASRLELKIARLSKK